MVTLSSSIISATTLAFPCPTCGQELSRRGDLQRHIAQLHPTGNEQLWKCPHCPYQHVQKSNVKIHAEKHELKRTGERPHTCPESGCTAAYQDKGLLTRHRKKKHGFQPNHSSRYLEKKGLSFGADIIATSRLSSEGGETSRRDQQMYGVSQSPPESASIVGRTPPPEAYAREKGDGITLATGYNLESIRGTSSAPRLDVAYQSDPSPTALALRLPPIAKLFQEADDCERNRRPPSFVPRFPGPLVVAHCRPASAQGYIGFHAPQPEYFQRMSDTADLLPTSISSMMRERRPSSTPCLPTPPAFQTTFPSPSASHEALLSGTSKIYDTARTPVSFVRQKRRPAPYPVKRDNDRLASNAPRWHKWWMATGTAEPRETCIQLMARALTVRSH